MDISFLSDIIFLEISFAMGIYVWHSSMVLEKQAGEVYKLRYCRHVLYMSGDNVCNRVANVVLACSCIKATVTL